jgi:glycerol uptake facilitator-like aquaporin
LFVFAAAFGIIIATVIVFFGSSSGAHINPAISLAHFLAGRLDRRLEVFYIFSQILGALVAGVVLSILFPASASTSFLGSTSLASNIAPVAGVVLELAGTFILATAVLYVSLAKVRIVYQASIIGLILFTLILLIGPLTGTSLNPARSIGPATASGFFDNLQVYIAGPLMGGLFAGIVAKGWRGLR